MRFVRGRIYSWAEVSRVHKSQNGIYQRSGTLVSMLTDFGRINPCYPDLQGETQDTIFYTGSGRRGDQKLDVRNQALIDAAGGRLGVPLFNKLSVGRWEYLGRWRVTDPKYVFDEKQDRMVWRFVLKKK
jgi:hypothetical protein